MNNQLNERAALAAIIAAKAEDGKVAIVYGGRDCDMAQWDNCVALVPATVAHCERWANDYMECAEGPQWWNYHNPSAVKDLNRTSRDLVMAAHEDGHPHVVHP